MAATPAPRTGDSRYVLHADGRVLILKSYVNGETAYVYDPCAQRDGYVAADDLSAPAAGQRVKLTAPQRDVAHFRFTDVATDRDDFGARVEGDVLVITDAVEALDTLDNAIELCVDAAADGVAGRTREAGVARRLRAKVLAAVRA